MTTIDTPIIATKRLNDLHDAESWIVSHVAQIGAADHEQRRVLLHQIGARWSAELADAEALAELGLALAHEHGLAPGFVLAELMLAYGATRDEQRTREWETDLMRRMAELRGLHRIISAANSTLDLDTSMQMVVETVAEVMSVEVCSVFLYDRDTEELMLRATRGLNTAAVGRVSVKMNEGITGASAHEGRPIVVRDVRSDARFRNETALGEEPYRAMLAVPIVLFNVERYNMGAARLQGVITLQTSEARDFSDDEIHFVETVSGELAFFIVNAQLYAQTDDQLHQKVRELTTLQQVSKLIAEQLSIEEVLRLIVTKSVELSRSDRADIFRVDAEGRMGLAATHGPGSRGEVHEFIAQAISEARPLAVLNAYTDSRFPELAPVAARENFFSLFCMPLRVQNNRTIGALCLYTSETRHFDFEQVRLLSTFADEAAIAIENARLYAESQRALAVKSAMLQEMHHRVRNNLQTISALLTMQLRRMDRDGVAAGALRDGVARIQAIAGVHNLLCREDIGITTVDAVAGQILDSARVTLERPEQPLRFAVAGDAARIGARQATVLAIVLNELIVNAITHGLAAAGGTVVVETQQHDEQITVEVRDDGPLHHHEPRNTSGTGMGLQIIRTLVHDDLLGSFAMTSDGEWTRAVVIFPQQLSEGEG